MTSDHDTRAEQQGDGQPENQREIEDRAGGAAMSGGASARGADVPTAGRGTGDTSDAGSADAAPAEAAPERGLAGDRARQTGSSELEQDL